MIALRGLFEVGISSFLIDDLLKPLYVSIVYSACSALSICFDFKGILPTLRTF